MQSLALLIVCPLQHNGSQWNDDAEPATLRFSSFNARSTGWGGYLVLVTTGGEECQFHIRSILSLLLVHHRFQILEWVVLPLHRHLLRIFPEMARCFPLLINFGVFEDMIVAIEGCVQLLPSSGLMVCRRSMLGGAVEFRSWNK